MARQRGLRKAILSLAALAPLASLPPDPSRSTPNGDSSPRARLLAEIGPARALVARLSGFEYRALERRAVFDGREKDYYTLPAQLELAQVGALSRFMRAAEATHAREATPESLADLALAILLGQQPDQLPAAVTLLETAVAASPHDPALLSDLAAAYLASYRPRPNRRLALGAASRAVREDPSFAPARFNLAMAIEDVGLSRQARNAWSDYLRLDPDSGWAAEAREHLWRLRDLTPEALWLFHLQDVAAYGVPPSLPRELHERARGAVTEDLLGDWATLRANGKLVEAEQRLARLRPVGRMFGQAWSDKTVADAITTIDNAAGNEALLDGLVAGHRAYQDATRLLRGGRSDLAIPSFELAANALAGSGSPLPHWAHATLAELAVLAGDYHRGEALLGKVRDDANLSRYPALNARLLLVDGRLSAARGELATARAAFRTAERAARLASEHGVSTAASLLLAECVPFGGAVDWQGLRFMRHELQWMPRSYHPWLLRDLAHALGDQPATALALLDLGIAEAAEVKDPGATVPLLLERLRIDRRAGDHAGAERDASQLTRVIHDVGDPIRRAAWEAEAAIARCQTLPSADHECVVLLSRAIAESKGRDRRLLAAALEARAAVRRRLGDALAAEHDLLAAVELYEAGVLALRRPDETAEMLSQGVALQAARGDTDAAFDLDERVRALALPREGPPDRPPPAGYIGCNLRPYSPREFRHGLPAYTTVVEYHVAENVAADITRRDGLRHIQLAVTDRQLQEALTTVDRAQRRQLLSELLLKPIARSLPAEGEIVFLAPRPLWTVGFDSLFVERGRRLCARQGVATVPTGQLSVSQQSGGVVEIARDALTWHPEATQPKAASFLPSRSTLPRLPATTALLKYRLLDDRLYTWVATSAGTSLTSVVLSSRRLSSLVEELARGARGLAPGADVDTVLFDLLVAPGRERLVGCRDLVVIPDPVMAGLPFALLRDRRSGRRLIEDHSIAVSPTASLYVDQRLRHGAPEHSQWSVLTVSDGTPGPADAARVPLPGGLAEIAALRKLFPRSESISTAVPRPPVPRVSGFHVYPAPPGFRNHAVVHFVGHWDPEHPTYDWSRQADRLPTSAETRLIVLAACDTLRSPSWREQGGFGLAYRHLAAGVPAVVASLWQLDDAATSQLMLRFYEGLRGGVDAANSLRSAQLSLLHGEDRSLREPRAWAGMQVVGFGGI